MPSWLGSDNICAEIDKVKCTVSIFAAIIAQAAAGIR